MAGWGPQPNWQNPQWQPPPGPGGWWSAQPPPRKTPTPPDMPMSEDEYRRRRFEEDRRLEQVREDERRRVERREQEERDMKERWRRDDEDKRRHAKEEEKRIIREAEERDKEDERKYEEWKEEKARKEKKKKDEFEAMKVEEAAREKKQKEAAEKEMRDQLVKKGLSQNQIDWIMKDKADDKRGRRRASSAVGPGNALARVEPVFPIIYRKDISLDTLRHYNLDWQYYEKDPDYIQINEELTREDTDVLFAHTAKLRGKKPKSPKLLESGEEKKDYAFIRKRSKSRGKSPARSPPRSKSPLNVRWAEKIVKGL